MELHLPFVTIHAAREPSLHVTRPWSSGTPPTPHINTEPAPRRHRREESWTPSSHCRVRRPLRLAAGHEVPVCVTRRVEDRAVTDMECRDVAPEPGAVAEPQAAVTAVRLQCVLGLRAAVMQVLHQRPALP
jgi:hypothetical protein